MNIFLQKKKLINPYSLRMKYNLFVLIVVADMTHNMANKTTETPSIPKG
jgi:hypothetical protein